jgi:DNA segregation ATPase FtsK/SpoIIIE, S-DNA-T family
MAKTTVRWASREALAVVKLRLAETVGFAMLLLCLLVFLSLFTYDPRDGSLNTAVDATPHNFLGHDGAVLADLLWQGLGLACFLIPILLLAWSFRLMLHRPLRSAWTRLALLPAVLTLGAVALSILDLGALSPPAGPGGAIGWVMERLLVRSGLGTATLPISMAAAAVAGLLLLATMGLSLRDWRAIGAGAGRGATRLAELSGSGSAKADSMLGRVWCRWRKSRFARTPESDRRSDEVRRPPVVTPLPSRREPRLSQSQTGAPAGARDRGGLVRFIAPKARPPAPGKRAEEERQPALDLEPDQQPLLPSLELLVKPPAAKAEAIN